MRFLMKQKIFTLRDSFEIFDQHQQVVLFAKSRIFSIRKSFTLLDPNEQPVAEIRQKLLAFRPTFYITTSNGQRYCIKKTFFPLFHSRFLIKGPDCSLIIAGNFLGHEYQFFNPKEQLVAEVSKQWFSWSDTYGIDVSDESLSELIISAVIVIDATMHDDKNSNFD